VGRPQSLGRPAGARPDLPGRDRSDRRLCSGDRATCELASCDQTAPVRHARKNASEASQLAGAVGRGKGGEPLAVRLAPHVGLAMAGNFLVNLRAVRGPSSRCPPDGRDGRVLPLLAHARVIEDDAPMPKSHKVAFPGNPVQGPALREKVTAGLQDRGRIIEFLFDPKKNLADVTIETERDEDLSFEEVIHLLGDVPLYQVGPINLERILE
jgi:hypothetical protein